MLERLILENFTVFRHADVQWGRHLNVIVGENGTGKTHLLKLLYSVLATSWQEGRKPQSTSPTKTLLQMQLADKLRAVFRPESLGRLARRKQGRERCDVQLRFDSAALNMDFGFATNSKSEVSVKTLPTQWLDAAPVYLPTRELLSMYPGFAALYRSHYLEYDETWFDTCLLLDEMLPRGVKESRIQTLLAPLETAMQGRLELDKNGRFYLRTASGRVEMSLLAEGLRKLGMLARLIATGALLDQGTLFWDEPEANLNPRLIRRVAETIVALSASGLQIFIATNSLFLLRELEVLLAASHKELDVQLDVRYIGLHTAAEGVQVLQGRSLDDIGDIAALEESLHQSDRYLSLEDALHEPTAHSY